MAKEQNIRISCNSCSHKITVDKSWVNGKIHVGPHASTETIVFALVDSSQRLVCTRCGSREPKILCTFLSPVNHKLVPEEERIFIDEGIGGTREDNKKARGRQSANNRKVKN